MKTLDTWRPVARATVASSEPLSEFAARTLAHVDGSTAVLELAERTGMDMGDVLAALGDLVSRGLVASEDAPAEIVQLAHAQTAYRRAAPPPVAIDESIDDLPELEDLGPASAEDLSELPELDLGAMDESSPPDEDGSSVGSHRKLYESVLHPLPVDARTERARTADGDVLCALCLDPVPGVIEAVLENPNANLTHARLVAEHHRNPVGLDAVGRRAEYLRDSTVRRMLMRNPQASERLLVRMLAALPLTHVFRANVGHELTERARHAGRTVLRKKFDQAAAEEKVGLLVQTEGRCLPVLVGLTFDQKTTALLCRRTFQSTMLIQSLARFPASPPTLIVHLLKQQIVVRNQHLKKSLQQHPNCPKYLKR